MVADDLKAPVATKKEIRRTLELHDCIRFDGIASAKSLIKNLSMEKRRKQTRPVQEQERRLQPALFVALDEGKTDFVKFLVNECGADINDEHVSRTLKNDVLEPKTDMEPARDTYLMMSVDWVEICRFLLDKGAKVNSKNSNGETALHIAASRDCIESARLLLGRGANPFSQNKEGDDVLRMASLNGRKKIANLLLKTVFKDVKREIESYHLLGHRFVEQTYIAKALPLWEKAITLAAENHIQTVATKFETPCGVVVEATSLSELDTIRRNKDDICMQSIVLCYKYLGPTHSMFQEVILSCAHRFFNVQSFEKCWRLLIYCIRNILNSAVQLLVKCSRLNCILFETERCMAALRTNKMRPSHDFAAVYEFMEIVTQQAIKSTKPEETDIFIKLTLNVIFLYTLMDFQKQENLTFQKLVCAVIKAGPKTEKKKSILLEAVDPRSIFMFPPCFSVVNMLLECGSDASERDENRNNAVHAMVNSFIKNGKRFEYQFRRIAGKLIEYGVHLDARNNQRKEAASCLQDLGIRIAPPINLMCSSARAIRRFNFSLQGLERLLPKFLIDFVEMH